MSRRPKQVASQDSVEAIILPLMNWPAHKRTAFVETVEQRTYFVDEQLVIRQSELSSFGFLSEIERRNAQKEVSKSFA